VLDSLLHSFLVSPNKLANLFSELSQLCEGANTQCALEHVVMQAASLIRMEPTVPVISESSGPIVTSSSSAADMKNEIVVRDKILAVRLHQIFEYCKVNQKNHRFDSRLFASMMSSIRASDVDGLLRQELLRMPFLRIPDNLPSLSQEEFGAQLMAFCDFVASSSGDLKGVLLLMLLIVHQLDSDFNASLSNSSRHLDQKAFRRLAAAAIPSKAEFERLKNIGQYKDILKGHLQSAPRLIVLEGDESKSSSPYELRTNAMAVVSGVSVKPGSGFCYYEVTIKGTIKEGVRVGWRLCGSDNPVAIGDDASSWGFDGYVGFLFHNAAEISQIRAETVNFQEDEPPGSLAELDLASESIAGFPELPADPDTDAAAGAGNEKHGTYKRLVRIGLPDEAIRMSMLRDGVSNEEVDAFLVSAASLRETQSAKRATQESSAAQEAKLASFKYVCARKDAFRSGGTCVVGSFGEDEAETEAEALALSVNIEAWKEGNILGCLLERSTGTLSYYLNGKCLTDQDGTDLASRQVPMDLFRQHGVCPTLSSIDGCILELNIGQNAFAHCPAKVVDSASAKPEIVYPQPVTCGNNSQCTITQLSVDYFTKELCITASLSFQSSLSLGDFAGKSIIRLNGLITIDTPKITRTVVSKEKSTSVETIVMVFGLPSLYPSSMLSRDAEFFFGNGLFPVIRFSCAEYSNFQAADAEKFCAPSQAKSGASSNVITENRAGVPVFLGKDLATYYCGRHLGYAIPYSDGSCGPTNGPQCNDCKGLVLHIPKCTQGHTMVALTEKPAEYNSPPMCDACRERNLFARNKFYYHCKPCGYDLCEACCVRYVKTQSKANQIAEKATTKSSKSSSQAAASAAASLLAARPNPPSYAVYSCSDSFLLKMNPESSVSVADFSTRKLSACSLEFSFRRNWQSADIVADESGPAPMLNLFLTLNHRVKRVTTPAEPLPQLLPPPPAAPATPDSAPANPPSILDLDIGPIVAAILESVQEPIESKALAGAQSENAQSLPKKSTATSESKTTPRLEHPAFTVAKDLKLSVELQRDGRFRYFLNDVLVSQSVVPITVQGGWCQLGLTLASPAAALAKGTDSVNIFAQSLPVKMQLNERESSLANELLDFETLTINRMEVVTDSVSSLDVADLRMWSGILPSATMASNLNRYSVSGPATDILFSLCCEDLLSPSTVVRDFVRPRPPELTAVCGDVQRIAVTNEMLLDLAVDYVTKTTSAISLNLDDLDSARELSNVVSIITAVSEKLVKSVDNFEQLNKTLGDKSEKLLNIFCKSVVDADKLCMCLLSSNLEKIKILERNVENDVSSRLALLEAANALLKVLKLNLSIFSKPPSGSSSSSANAAARSPFKVSTTVKCMLTLLDIIDDYSTVEEADQHYVLKQEVKEAAIECLIVGFNGFCSEQFDKLVVIRAVLKVILQSTQSNRSTTSSASFAGLLDVPVLTSDQQRFNEVINRIESMKYMGASQLGSVLLKHCSVLTNLAGLIPVELFPVSQYPASASAYSFLASATLPSQKNPTSLARASIVIGSYVQRGPDWVYDDQDGGINSQGGLVVRLDQWPNDPNPNTAVAVLWKQTNVINVYRYGVREKLSETEGDEKVSFDIMLVSQSASALSTQSLSGSSVAVRDPCRKGKYPKHSYEGLRSVSGDGKFILSATDIWHDLIAVATPEWISMSCNGLANIGTVRSVPNREDAVLLYDSFRTALSQSVGGKELMLSSPSKLMTFNVKSLLETILVDCMSIIQKLKGEDCAVYTNFLVGLQYYIAGSATTSQPSNSQSSSSSGAATVLSASCPEPAQRLFKPNFQNPLSASMAWNWADNSWSSIAAAEQPTSSDGGEKSQQAKFGFHPSKCCPTLTLKEALTVVQTANREWASVIGNIAMKPNTGVHKWRAVVRNIGSKRCHCIFGVATADIALDSFLGHDEYSWGLSSSKELLHGQSRMRTEYPCRIQVGSIIEVTLDTDAGTCTFIDISSSRKPEVAFKGLKGQVLYAAFSLYALNDTVEVLSYSPGSASAIGSLSALSKAASITAGPAFSSIFGAPHSIVTDYCSRLLHIASELLVDSETAVLNPLVSVNLMQLLSSLVRWQHIPKEAEKKLYEQLLEFISKLQSAITAAKLKVATFLLSGSGAGFPTIKSVDHLDSRVSSVASTPAPVEAGAELSVVSSTPVKPGNPFLAPLNAMLNSSNSVSSNNLAGSGAEIGSLLSVTPIPATTTAGASQSLLRGGLLASQSGDNSDAGASVAGAAAVGLDENSMALQLLQQLSTLSCTLAGSILAKWVRAQNITEVNEAVAKFTGELDPAVASAICNEKITIEGKRFSAYEAAFSQNNGNWISSILFSNGCTRSNDDTGALRVPIIDSIVNGQPGSIGQLLCTWLEGPIKAPPLVGKCIKLMFAAIIYHSGLAPVVNYFAAMLHNDVASDEAKQKEYAVPALLSTLWKESRKLHSVVSKAVQTNAAISTQSMCQKIENLLCFLFTLQPASQEYAVDKHFVDFKAVLAHFNKEKTKLLYMNPKTNEICSQVLDFATSGVSIPFLQAALLDANSRAIARSDGMKCLRSALELVSDDLGWAPKCAMLFGFPRALRGTSASSFFGPSGHAVSKTTPFKVAHFGSGFSGCQRQQQLEMKGAFDALFGHLLFEMNTANSSGYLCLLLELINCLNVYLNKEEHILLSRLDVFVALHEILESLTLSETCISPSELGAAPAVRNSEYKYAIKATMKLFTLYALQIASVRSDDLCTFGSRSQVASGSGLGSSASRSGPKTLGMKVFDILLLQLTRIVDSLRSQIDEAQEQRLVSGTNIKDDVLVLQLSSDHVSMLLEIISLLVYSAKDENCRNLLIKPRWIAVIFDFAMMGPSESRQKAIRILSDVLPHADIHELDSNISVFDVIFRRYMTLLGISGDGFENMTVSKQLIHLLLTVASPLFIPHVCHMFQSGNYIADESVGAVSFSQTAFPAQSEYISLLRSLLLAGSWRSTMEEVLASSLEVIEKKIVDRSEANAALPPIPAVTQSTKSSALSDEDSTQVESKDKSVAEGDSSKEKQASPQSSNEDSSSPVHATITPYEFRCAASALSVLGGHMEVPYTNGPVFIMDSNGSETEFGIILAFIESSDSAEVQYISLLESLPSDPIEANMAKSSKIVSLDQVRPVNRVPFDILKLGDKLLAMLVNVFRLAVIDCSTEDLSSGSFNGHMLRLLCAKSLCSICSANDSSSTVFKHILALSNSEGEASNSPHYANSAYFTNLLKKSIEFTTTGGIGDINVLEEHLSILLSHRLMSMYKKLVKSSKPISSDAAKVAGADDALSPDNDEMLSTPVQKDDTSQFTNLGMPESPTDITGVSVGLLSGDKYSTPPATIPSPTRLVMSSSTGSTMFFDYGSGVSALQLNESDPDLGTIGGGAEASERSDELSGRRSVDQLMGLGEGDVGLQQSTYDNQESYEDVHHEDNSEMVSTLESMGFPREMCEIACDMCGDLDEALNYILNNYSQLELATGGQQSGAAETEGTGESDTGMAVDQDIIPGEEDLPRHASEFQQDRLATPPKGLDEMYVDFYAGGDDIRPVDDWGEITMSANDVLAPEGRNEETNNRLTGSIYLPQQFMTPEPVSPSRSVSDNIQLGGSIVPRSPAKMANGAGTEETGSRSVENSEVPAGMVVKSVDYHYECHYDCYRDRFLPIYTAPTKHSERIGAIFPADELEILKECSDPNKPNSKWYQLKLSDYDPGDTGEYNEQVYSGEIYGWIPAYVDNTLVIIDGPSIGPQAELSPNRESIAMNSTYEVCISLTVRDGPETDEGDECEEDQEREVFVISPGERVVAVEEVLNSNGMVCLRIVSPCNGWITKVYGFVKKLEGHADDQTVEGRGDQQENAEDDEDAKSVLVDEWDSLFDLPDNLEDLDGHELFKKEDRLFGALQGQQFQRYKDPKRVKVRLAQSRRTRILNTAEKKSVYQAIANADHASIESFSSITGGLAVLYCRRAVLALLLKSRSKSITTFPNILMPAVSTCFYPHASSGESVSVSMSANVSLSTAPSMAIGAMPHISMPELEDSSCASRFSESSSRAISPNNTRHNPEVQVTELCSMLACFVALICFRGDPYYKCNLEYLVFDELTLASMSQSLVTVDLLLRPLMVALLTAGPDEPSSCANAAINHQVRYFQSLLQPTLMSVIINHVRMASESLNKDQFWLEFTYEEDIDSDCHTQPNIHFALWCSRVLLETHNTEIYGKLFKLWCLGGLRASSLSLKHIASDFLADILVDMRWASIAETARLSAAPDEGVIKVNAGLSWLKTMKDSLQVLPTDRLQIVASKRLWYEMEDDPAYSRFLQALLHLLSESRLAAEFAAELQTSRPDQQSANSPLQNSSAGGSLLLAESKSTSSKSVDDGSNATKAEESTRPYISFASNSSELQLSPSKDIQGPWTVEFWIKRNVSSEPAVMTSLSVSDDSSSNIARKVEDEEAPASTEAPSSGSGPSAATGSSMLGVRKLEKVNVPVEYLLHSPNGNIRLQTGGRIFPPGQLDDPLAEADPVADEAMCISFSQRGSTERLVLDCVIPTGKWVHIAIVNKVHPNPLVSVFVDGVFIDSKNFKFNLPLGSVGCGKTKQSFVGDLAEMRVWSSARTSAEIARDMLVDVSQAKGLVVHLCCREGSGIRTLDTMGLLTSCKLSSCDWKVGVAPMLCPHSVPSFVLSEPEECDGFFGQNIGKSAGVVELTGICRRNAVKGVSEGRYSGEEKEIVCFAYRVVEPGGKSATPVERVSKAVGGNVPIEGYLDWCDRGIRSSLVGTINEETEDVEFTLAPKSTVLGSPELADWESSTFTFVGKRNVANNTISGQFSFSMRLPGAPPLNSGDIEVDISALPKFLSYSKRRDNASIVILKDDAKKGKHMVAFNIKPYAPTSPTTTTAAIKAVDAPVGEQVDEDAVVMDCIHLDEGCQWFEWTVSVGRSSIILGVAATDAISIEGGEYVSSRNGIYENNGIWSYYQTGNLSNGQEKADRAKYVDADVIGISINTDVGEIVFYRNGTYVHCYKNLKEYAPALTTASGGSPALTPRVGFRPIMCLSRPGDVVTFHGPKKGPVTITYPEGSVTDNRSELFGVISNGAINGVAQLRFHGTSNFSVGHYVNGQRHGAQVTINVDNEQRRSLGPLASIFDSDLLIRSVLIADLAGDSKNSSLEISAEMRAQIQELVLTAEREFISMTPADNAGAASAGVFLTNISLVEQSSTGDDSTAVAVPSKLETVTAVVKGQGKPDITFTLSVTTKFRVLCETYCKLFDLSLPNVRFSYQSSEDSLATPLKYTCGKDFYMFSKTDFSANIGGNDFQATNFKFDVESRRVEATAGSYTFDFVFSADYLAIESGTVTLQSDSGQSKSWSYGTGDEELLFVRDDVIPTVVVDVDSTPAQVGFTSGRVIQVTKPTSLKATDKEGVAHLMKTSTAPFILQTLLNSGATVRTGVEIEDNPQVRMLEFAEVVESFEFTRTREGVGRYRIADGWISERLRGGNEETVVQVLRQLIVGTPREYRVIRSDGAIVRTGAELDTTSMGFCPCGTIIKTSEVKSVLHEGVMVQRVRIVSPETWAGGWASAKENILEPLTGGGERGPSPSKTGTTSSGKDKDKEKDKEKDKDKDPNAVDVDSELAAELARRNAVRAERRSSGRLSKDGRSSSSADSSRAEAFMVTKTIRGTIEVDADNFFLLSNNSSNKLTNVNFSSDCRSITCSSSNRVLVLGTRGFTRGLHYWEVQIDALGSWGSLFIGVAPAESTQWNHGYGLINYRATQAFGTETIYGSYYAANDVVGVLLDMDHGTISYFKDGDNIGKSVVINMGVAYHNLRRNGVSRSSSGMLFPCFGMKSTGDKITIKKKWVSSRGLAPSSLLEHLLNAKTVISRWRASYYTDCGPFTRLSSPLIEEMYEAYLRWRGHDQVLVRTRAGTEISVDTSAEAITRAAGSIGEIFTLREGTKFRSSYGDGVIVGARKGQVWFTLDNSDTGAWFWAQSELSDVISNGVVNFDDSYSAPTSHSAANAALTAGGDENIATTELSLAEFAACLEDASWTMYDDEALVQLVNSVSDKENMDPLRVPPQLLQRCRYRKQGSLVVLPKRSNNEVEVRYAALCVVNKALSMALPHCDFATTDNRVPLIFSPLARAHMSRNSCNRVLNPQQTFCKTASAVDILDMKTVIFSRVKMALWDRTLTETTTPTCAPPDEFERPDDLREFKINRPESLNAEARAALNRGSTTFNDKLRTSIFGQLLECLRSFDEKALRRSFVHVEDAGQRRSFFVKFVGEGVDDHGGPYRAVFQTAVGEDPATLQLLVPCPNAASESGENRDKYLINTAYLWQPTKLPLYTHLGTLLGVACRHKITVPLSLPALLWRSFSCEEVSLQDLESIDGQFISSLRHIADGGMELDFVGELLTEQLLSSWSLPTQVNDHTPLASTSSSAMSSSLNNSSGSASSAGGSDANGSAKAANSSFAAAIAKQLVFGHNNENNATIATAATAATTRIVSPPPPDGVGAGPMLPNIVIDQHRTSRVCELIKQLRLTQQQEGVNQLLKGIAGVVPVELLTLFTASEVELLFAGQPDMDVELLKSLTIYDSVSPTDRYPGRR
jgi:hypothetical protein